MPIQLTTPYYANPQVRIGVVGIDLRNSQIVLTIEYGDTDPGAAEVPEVPEVLEDLEAEPPVEGVPAVPAVPAVAPFWVPNGVISAETHTIMNHELETDGEIELVSADTIYDTLVGAALGSCTFVDKSADPSYTKVVLDHPEHGNLDLWVEKTYAGVKRQLYQWLLDEEVYAGTIV